MILNGCSTTPKTTRYERLEPIDTNAYNLYTDGTNIDIFSEQDIIAIHHQLVEYNLLKKDYYMVMDENEILKWRIEQYEEYSDPWYDNFIVGFFVGFAFTVGAVWSAGQIK